MLAVWHEPNQCSTFFVCHGHEKMCATVSKRAFNGAKSPSYCLPLIMREVLCSLPSTYYDIVEY